MSFDIHSTNYFPRARCRSLDDVPASPHAYDDEFNSTNLNAKWTKIAGTVAFDANPIDPTAGFSGGHRESHNSYRPSWYMLQPASVGYAGIIQPVTIPSECFMWARLSYNMRYTTNSDNDFEIGITLGADSGGSIDLNNRVLMHLNESAAGVAHIWGGKIVAGAFTVSQGRDLIPGSLANTSFIQPFCYVGIQKISTTYHFCAGTPSGHWLWLNSQTHASTMAWAGLYCANTDTGSPGNSIMGMDFFRFKAGRFLP